MRRYPRHPRNAPTEVGSRSRGRPPLGGQIQVRLFNALLVLLVIRQNREHQLDHGPRPPRSWTWPPVSGRGGAACGGAANRLAGVAPRHDLTFTTARQSEQGCGRRHVPGLRPPNHIGPQPPMRGIHPDPGIVHDPQDPAAPQSPRRSCSRSRRRRCHDRPRSCGRPRPCPRRRSCDGTWLLARLGEQSLASGHGATRCLPSVRALMRSPPAMTQARSGRALLRANS